MPRGGRARSVETAVHSNDAAQTPGRGARHHRVSSALLLPLLLVAALALAAPAQAATTLTPDIDVTRTLGPAPLAVFFDATRTTCSSCSDAYHDVVYSWDFGDNPNAVWALTGKPKNRAFGPVAAHVFEAPGTYRVTLAIAHPDGTRANASVTIDVQDPDGFWSGTRTMCFSTRGDFSGCPAGSQQVTESNWVTAMNSCEATNQRCLFRRGETFTSSVEWYLDSSNSGPSMVGAFGTGSKPRIRTTHGGRAINIAGSDWRFVDLEFAGPGPNSATTGIIAQDGKVDDHLFLRVDAVAGTYDICFSHSVVSGGLSEGIFYVESLCDDPITYGYIGNASKVVFLGTRVFSPGLYSIRNNHVVQGVFSNNELGPPTTSNLDFRSFDQKTNSTCGQFCGTATRQVVISDNILRPNSPGQAVQVCKGQTSTETARCEDFLVERNFVFGNAGMFVQMEFQNDLEGLTVESNVFNMNGFDGHLAISVSGSTDGANVSHNTCYTTDGGSSFNQCVRVNASSSKVYNNLAYYPNATNPVVVSGSPGVSAGNVLTSVNPFAGGNPTIVDYYKLGPDSPLINAGSMATSSDLDFRQQPRHLGSAPDVGAFEQGSGAAPPPPAPLLLK